MKRKFKFCSGFDIEVELEIDLIQMTPERAQETATFWGSSDDVLRASDGDMIEAVARYAAAVFVSEALEGNNVLHNNYNPFAEREGWYLDDGVIECTDITIPEWSAEDFRKVED